MKYILAFFVIITFSNCAKKEYIHLYQVKPKWVNTNDENVFENDTIKVTYSFWSEAGTFSFSFYNKLDIPLYIDWKKSSFVKNGNKLDYWSDAIVTKSKTVGRRESIQYYRTVFSVEEGFSSSISQKPERITFVAPKSTIYKVQFELQTEKDQKFNSSSAITEEVSRIDQPKKKTNLLHINYDEGNSKLFFRNYMTFSTTDKFETESKIDNAFYLSKVTEMDMPYFFNNKHAKDFSADYNFERNRFKSPYQHRLYYYTIVR
jgi:hypothetical protein